MPSEQPPSVSLNGKSYPLSWGNLSKIRFSAIPEEIRSMGTPVDDAVMVWSCIAVKPNPFLTWEHVAEHISKDNIDQVREALATLFPAPTEEKKTPPENGPLTASV